MSIKNTWLIILVIISFCIKFLLMPISAHSDLFSINMFPPLLFQERVIDIFEYVDKFDPHKGFSYYSPFTYYFFGFIHYIFNLITPSITEWMSSLRQIYLDGLMGQAVDFIHYAPSPNIFLDLFILKLPYLIADLAAVLIFFKISKSRIINKWHILVWVFNPVILYTTYIFGQYDILVILFILLGFLIIKKRLNIGFLILGIAGAFKIYPYLIIIPAAFIFGKNLKEKLRLLVISFLPFIITTIPILINSPQLVLFTFFPKNIFHYKIILYSWDKYSPIIKYVLLATSYIGILAVAIFLKIKDKWKFAIGLSLVTFLLVIILAGRTHFHYLIWEIPLLILWFGARPKFVALVTLIQTISFASYKLLASQLQLGLFAPLAPDYFSNLPTFNSLINELIPYRIISTFGFVIFTATNVYLIISILNQLLFKTTVQEKV